MAPHFSQTTRLPRPWIHGLLALLLLLSLCGGRLSMPARARADGPCTVTTAADLAAPVPAESLRARLADPNCSAITFNLAAMGSGTITLADTLPSIGRAVTITGPGGGLTIQGNNTFPLVLINAPGLAVGLSGVTLTKGQATASSGFGGNLRSIGGNVSLTDVTLSAGTAESGQGGAGAYFSNGTSTLTRVTISGNTAPGSTSYGTGAGVYIGEKYGDVSVTLTDSHIVGNTATAGGGGGLALRRETSGSGRSLSAQLTNSTIGTVASPNKADAGAGGGIFQVGGVLTLTNSTVTGNIATRGGGIDCSGGPLTLNTSTVSGNTSATSGGGISCFGPPVIVGGTLTLNSSAVSGNSAATGGGISSLGAPVTLTNSTIAGNTATGDGGGMVIDRATVTALNSTISGNTSGGSGGGVALLSSSATLSFATLVKNSATGGADGIFARAFTFVTSITLQGSIVAANGQGSTPRDCAVDPNSQPLPALVSGGDNLIGNNTGCANDGTTDIVLTLPLASVLEAALADHGGPTRTHALVVGSPALDRIPLARCTIINDQRGRVRPQPQGGNCDIGAYEAGVAALTVAANGPGTATPPSGTFTEGSTIAISAAPNAGATFIGWTVDGSPAGATNPLTITLNAAHSVVATFAPSSVPSPSPSPSPSLSPVPSPSPSPSSAPGATMTLTTSGGGQVQVSPPSGSVIGTTQGYTPGTVVTLAAQPASGQILVGWTVDGQAQGWAITVTITMQADHSVTAVFAPSPAFGDVAGDAPYAAAVSQLAARGVVNGCDASATPPLFCPDAPTLRAQMAALLVRAMPGWATETWPNTFADPLPDTELWGRVATLQHYSVAQGYAGETCAAQGKGVPCFGPLDPVTYGQTLLFISRAMVTRGYWVLHPDDTTIFPELNGTTPREIADHQSLVTYVHYAGAPPDVSVAPGVAFHVNGTAQGGWGDASGRGWFARALWQALNSYFGTDLIP